MSTGSVGAFVFVFIQGLIVPRILAPDEYGTLAILNLVFSYMGYIQLGMKSAQTVLVPAALGKGDKTDAQHITEVVFTSETLLTILMGVGLWAIYIGGVTLGNTLTSSLVLILSVRILLSRFDELLDSYLLGYGEFGSLARLQFFTAFSNLLFGIPLLLLYGIPGFLSSVILTYLILDSYIILRHRIRLRFRWSWKELARYIKVGFPIYVNNWVGVYLWTLEKTLIALLLDKVALGLYSFGLLVFAPVSLIPGSWSKIVRRRMAECYGQFGSGDLRFMQRFFEFPLSGYLFLCTVIIGSAYNFYQVLVMNFYPQYLPSITVFQLLIFGYPFFQLRVFTGAMLTVINRSWDFLTSQAIILVINAIIDYTLIYAGYGIYGAAVGSSLSYTILGFLLFYQAYRYVSPLNPVKSALILYLRISVSWIACYALLLILGVIEWQWLPVMEGEARVVVSVFLALLNSILFIFGSLGVFTLVFQKDQFFAHVMAFVWESGAIVRHQIALRLA